jgi:hypothetical protein
MMYGRCGADAVTDGIPKKIITFCSLRIELRISASDQDELSAGVKKSFEANLEETSAFLLEEY